MTNTAHACASCGASAIWLVCADYGQGLGGRLMPYCDGCRREKLDSITACAPIALVECDPEGSLLALYTAGLTQSDPATFSEMFWPGLTSEWVTKAAAQVERWNRLLPTT